MARRRALGRALTGFAENFLPAWQSMQYMDRLKASELRADEREERLRRRDARADYTTEGERLARQFGTASDVDAALADLQLLHPDVFSDEEGRASLERYVPTESARLTEAVRRAGDNLPFLSESQALQGLSDVGLPGQFRTLPSTSMTGVIAPGQPGSGVEPFLRMDPAHTSDDVTLADLQVSPPGAEELLGGLTFEKQAAVPTDLAEQWGALREGALSTLEDKAAFQRELDEQSRLGLLGIDEQFAADHYDVQTDREIKRLNALAPTMRQIALEDIRSELTERQRISRDPEQLAFDVGRQREFAKINAIMSGTPQFMPRIDPETGDITTTMMFRGPDGFWKLQNMSGVFPGVPLTGAATASMFDPTAKLLQEALAYGVDLTDPEKRELLVGEAVTRGIDPDIAASQIDATARMAAVASGDGPPIPLDAAEGNVSQFLPQLSDGGAPGAGPVSGMPLTVPSMEDIGLLGTESTVELPSGRKGTILKPLYPEPSLTDAISGIPDEALDILRGLADPGTPEQRRSRMFGISR